MLENGQIRKGKKLLIFDLGGVVFKHSFDNALSYWAEKGKTSFSRIKGLYRHDDAYERHEIAAISIDQYKEHVCRMLDLNLSKEEFIIGWNSIFMEEIPGVRTLLERLKDEYVVVALSNTNDTHRLFILEKYREVLSLFRRVYFSPEVGFRKPGKEIFLKALSEHGVQPSEALFFDDVLENVEGAGKVGIDTVLVDGYPSIVAGLSKYGIVPGSV